MDERKEGRMDGRTEKERGQLLPPGLDLLERCSAVRHLHVRGDDRGGGGGGGGGGAG